MLTASAAGLLLLICLKSINCLLPSGEKLENEYLPDLTPSCLGCICEATTNCNLTIGCLGQHCGPFFISRAYWKEAGSPVLYGDTPTRVEAYETCVNDPYCAATTLTRYMFRFAQDCNENGVLECDDYARIHYLGGEQCHLPVHRFGYYGVFRNCHVAVQLLN
ncbi:hypothetical protein RUM43_003710 [Polyplax serrata]|uniref:lysozyme n=1 Tax=Polyplax serrata TaxID=468196 RepID=A0AAN8S6L2_POLSC